MNRTGSLPLAAALLFCLLPANVLYAQSDQPSLADVARQKSAAKAKRVVTNDEIPPSPEADKPLPSLSADSPATAAAGKPEAAAKNNKAAKPDSVPEKPTKLQELLTERANLEQILKKMQDKVAETNDEQRQATLGQVVEHTQEALDENQKEIDQLRASEPAAENSTGANPPAADQSPSAQQPPK
jgi:hypothetical protein